MTEGRLNGHSILIVEDEYLIAQELAQEVLGAGGTVIGPAPTMDSAAKLLENSPLPTVAVLDVNLSGEPVFSLADSLAQRGVPLVFATGYDATALPARFANAPSCAKPLFAGQITEAILSVVEPRMSVGLMPNAPFI